MYVCAPSPDVRTMCRTRPPLSLLRLKHCISLCGESAKVSLVGARRAPPRVPAAPHMKQFLDPLHSKCERNYRFLNDAHRLLSTKLFLARGGGTFFVCVLAGARLHTTPWPRCPRHMASWKKKGNFLFLPAGQPSRAHYEPARHMNTVCVQV